MERISIFGFNLAVLCLVIFEIACDGHTHVSNNIQSEQKALIDFKNSLSDPNNRLSSWKGSNHCYWEGIDCENGTFVVSIDLHNPYPYPSENVYENQSLSGVISPSLVKLKYLKHLDLSFNSFKAIPIPQFIGSLKNLIYLNLSQCGFIGAIPSNLGNLSNLQYLDISCEYNYPSDLFIESIEWMTNLVALKHFSANNVNLSMTGSQWIEVLNKLSVLTELHLDGCSLFGSIPSPSFVNFTALTIISISSNEFNSSFPEWLLNVGSLEWVDISSNELHGRVPFGLSKLPNLQYLNLSMNYYLEGDISELLRKNWRKIEFLDLSANHLHGSIPSSIGNFCNLQYLNLRGNELNGSLPEIVNGYETCNSKSPLPNLRELDLSGNQLQDSIPSSIGNFCNLQYLNLRSNNLNGSLPEIINGYETCNSKSPLSNLRELDLSDNRLKGKLPKWLGELKNLTRLSLIYEKLEGPIPTMQQLEFLYLEGNELNGSMLDGIGQLSQLKELSLSSNQLSGTLSEKHFLKLSQLESLNLYLLGLIVSSNWVPPFKLTTLSMRSCHIGSAFPAWLQSQKNLRFLDLAYTGISSFIPSWFGNISFNLEELDLSDNQLQGSIPSSIGNFCNLHYLDLSYNNLNGSLPEIANGYETCNPKSPLPNLRELDLSHNQLQGSIPSSIGSFCNLQYLNLKGNELNGSLPEIVNGYETCNPKSPLPNLRELDLSGNQLQGKLPNWLGQLKSLRTLSLSYKKLEGLIPRLQQLEFLDLDGNELNGNMLDGIGQLSQLKELRLYSNQLSGNLSEKHFFKLSQLESLYLELLGLNVSSNWVPPFKLTTLSMRSCDIGPAFPAWLQSQNNLEYLDLSNASISSFIPSWLGNISFNMYQLDLSDNQLQGSVPSSIGNLTNLNYLDFTSNRLSGTLSEQHFWKLNQLRRLLMDSNSFRLDVSSNWTPPFQLEYLSMSSCDVGPTFPGWLQSQNNLGYLDLSNASISSSIPNWFWNMSSNMQYLILSHNQLHGPLPNSNIGDFLPNLLFLSFSGNRIGGMIPNSIGYLSSLEVIDFSSNNLIGSIPSTISNCSSLIILDLGNNNLFGMIPKSLIQLQYLESLHLNHNELFGELPSSLQNLTSLDVLDLSYNKLWGQMPAWIGTAFPNLVILNLRFNMFSGRLPFILSNLSSLHILDLAQNNLTGEIPVTLVELKAMTQEKDIYSLYNNGSSSGYEEKLIVITKGQSLEYTRTLSLVISIDLSDNSLSGKFPEGITKLFGLVSLNLSMNQITGRIPESISNLRQLDSLDLSSNKLFGSIPSSMSSLSFLGYLNLSNNNFSGMIPFIGHMSTFTESAFIENPNLCGAPLVIRCTDDEDSDKRQSDVEDKIGDGYIDQWFYLSIGLGFAMGILVPYFVLAMKRSWSNAYFDFVDKIVKWLLFRRVTYARNHAQRQ